jgi:hypothetical protein
MSLSVHSQGKALCAHPILLCRLVGLMAASIRAIDMAIVCLFQLLGLGLAHFAVGNSIMD